MHAQFPPFIEVAPEIAEAGTHGRPIVALESTVISHGLPWPDNLALAQRMEETVRAGGAVPATIGILSGRIVVGLNAAQIEHLARAQTVRKVSRRDLALVRARHEDGATTVATTIWCAALCGIRVMATGGIGGVHRTTLPDGRPTGQAYDVSADLPEIARTPVVVVCAGAKAILDLPATREWLETAGVPVLGWETDEFPAFYSIASGLATDTRVDNAADAAALLRAHWEMELGGALVVAPPPAEHAVPTEEIERALAQALAEADQQGVHGKAATPFLLSRVSALTAGRSRAANLALLANNARIGAALAVALAG